MLTHEAHRVGNNVVFGHFTNFGGRSVIRDKHKRLAEYSWMTLYVFLVSRGRVGSRSTAMCDISGNSDQERRGLTPCLESKRSYRGRTLMRSMCVNPPGIGWQSKDCTSCCVFGIFDMRSRTPCEPSCGFPFQLTAELGR